MKLTLSNGPRGAAVRVWWRELSRSSWLIRPLVGAEGPQRLSDMLAEEAA